MEFLKNVLKDNCLKCDICCRFPEKYSPLIPFFLHSEMVEAKYFPCIGSHYGCRIDTVSYKDHYSCPNFSEKTNGCNIYEKRPLDCRLYPFMITYDEDYKNVILVIDRNCPYADELIPYSKEVMRFVNSLEILPQDIGFINDPQPDVINVGVLPYLTKYYFGDFCRFQKISIHDKDIPVPIYLWRDILNIVCKTTEMGREIFYGMNDNFVRLKNGGNDYLYLTKDLSELKGDKYKGKRNLCNYFEKNYKYAVDRLSPSEDIITECLSLYKSWAEKKGAKNKDTYFNQLIEDSFFFHKRALLDFERLGLNGLLVWIDDKIAGYTFGTETGKDTFCILGEITNSNYKGIGPFIFREFCRSLPASFTCVNTMDDSEIAGVKNNKASYHPLKTK